MLERTGPVRTRAKGFDRTHLVSPEAGIGR